MKLADIFTDGMVLQANKKIHVFGNGKGILEIEFLGKHYRKECVDDKWDMELEPHTYGGPYQMNILLDGEKIILKDIMFGEVLLCAGQSNMQFEIKMETEWENVQVNDKIRYFYSDNIEGNSKLKSSMGWLYTNQENLKEFSALAYHTAEGIVRDKDVCVGLIACVQGASVIRSWMSEDVLTEDVYLPLEQRHSDSVEPMYALFNQDAACYRKTFLPITPYAVSRVLWYQGESNTTVAEGTVYFRLLEKLIVLWRAQMQDDTLPFVVIQICDLDVRDDEGWHVIQEIQLHAKDEIPFVDVVTSSDVCTHTDIHPNDKRKLARKILEMIK